MFTGLIERTAEVLEYHSQRLSIVNPFEDIQVGESVAVNGVCLTVLPGPQGELHFDLSSETLDVTTLGDLFAGDLVNLERAMLASTRFGGHYVSGHVDEKAQVYSLKTEGDFVAFSLSGFKPESFLYLLPKGSLTVHGVSLTINAVIENRVEFMLVPHTLSVTNLGQLKPGQQVNIEFDYLTRIVAHQLQVARHLNEEVVL